MPTALLKFVQGATIGAPGQSIFGVTGTSVTASSAGSNPGVTRAVFTLLWVPENSAHTIGVQQDTSGVGLLLSWSFNPDSSDAYVVQLTLYDSAGNTYVSTQMFGVCRPSGLFVPGFTTDPSQWNFSNNLGVGGAPFGWAPHANALHEWNEPSPIRLNAASSSLQLTQKMVGKTIYLDVVSHGAFTVLLPTAITGLDGNAGGDGFRFMFKDPNGGWSPSVFPTIQDNTPRLIEDLIASGTWPHNYVQAKLVGGRYTLELDKTNNRWVT